MYLRDSSFWQYEAYAGIRRGPIERRHQTAVMSRVMRTCCGRMLMFISCVRNKLATSLTISLSSAGF